jgi:hypothetical protein
MNAQEILNLVQVQKNIFDKVYIERDKDEFYRGIIAGLDIVKAYCEIVKKSEKV